MNPFKLIKKTLKWIVVAFFASTILSVVMFRFLPVWVTPLMVIRCCQQVSEGKDLKLSHDWVSLEEISPSLPVAVIASEDARFMEHHGFDYEAIEHAAKRNREHPEKRKLGASTISQQTAKNVFLWPGRSWTRKGFEVQGPVCADCRHTPQSPQVLQQVAIILYAETTGPHLERDALRQVVPPKIAKVKQLVLVS